MRERERGGGGIRMNLFRFMSCFDAINPHVLLRLTSLPDGLGSLCI